MAASAAARILRTPGRLVVGVTQSLLGSNFPFGGTEVGKVNKCALSKNGRNVPISFEGLGAYGDVLAGPDYWRFAVFVRGWDDDAVAQFMAPGFEAGANTRHATLKVPGERVPGTSLLPHAVQLVFVPDDTVHATALLIYRAVPDYDGAIAFERKTEFGLPLVFELMGDADGRILHLGRIKDLEL